MLRKLFLVALLLLASAFNRAAAQEVNITAQLKAIENGEVSKAKGDLQKLKEQHSSDPSVQFLDAVLTAEGKEALSKYTLLVESYPKSNYADAAVYKIYQYYFALGHYSTAQTYLDLLKKDYPNSPYIKYAGSRLAQAGTANISKIPQPSNAKYTIQAGAFLQAANAEKLSKSLTDDGYSAEVKQKEVAGTILNVVYAGRFVKEEDAKKELVSINTEYKLDGRVVLIEK